MRYIVKEKKLCYSCMEVHIVGLVEIQESGTYKNELVDFSAIYDYCSNLDVLSEDESMMRRNSTGQREAYAVRMAEKSML